MGPTLNSKNCITHAVISIALTVRKPKKVMSKGKPVDEDSFSIRSTEGQNVEVINKCLYQVEKSG